MRKTINISTVAFLWVFAQGCLGKISLDPALPPSNSEVISSAPPPKSEVPIDSEELPVETPAVRTALFAKQVLLNRELTTQEAELSQSRDKIESLIDAWLASPEFVPVLQKFLAYGFQQGATADPQEKFMQTATARIQAGEPFDTLVTTKTFLLSPLQRFEAVLEANGFKSPGQLQRAFELVAPGKVPRYVTRVIPYANSINPAHPDYMIFHVPLLQASIDAFNNNTATNPNNVRWCRNDMVHADGGDARINTLLTYLRTGNLSVKVNTGDAITRQANCNIGKGGPSFLEATGANPNEIKEITFEQTFDTQRIISFLDRQAIVSLDVFKVRSPQVGFVTGSEFRQVWPTNQDNQFRVTVNQALLVGLGQGIELNNPTLSTREDLLTGAHAAVGTTCYTCHLTLDPMAQVFKRYFVPADVNRLLFEQGNNVPTGEFSFFGIQKSLTTIDDFAEAIVQHPLFYEKWTRLSYNYLLNSDVPKEDKDFAQIVESARSHRDLKKLWKDILMIYVVRPKAYAKHVAPAILPGQTWCARLGKQFTLPQGGGTGVCAGIALSLNNDVYERGDSSFFRIAESNAVDTRGRYGACRRLATMVVNNNTKDGRLILSSSNVPEAIEVVVQKLFGITKQDAAYQDVYNILMNHYDAVLAASDAKTALQSVVVTGCMSAYSSSNGL